MEEITKKITTQTVPPGITTVLPVVNQTPQINIFTSEEFGTIRTIEKKNQNKHTGFFYILEWDDLVKIGSTQNPYQRIMALKRTAETYGRSKLGRVAFSKPHTNYTSNEKRLHKYFSKYRQKGSELFNITFNKAINNIPNDIEYLDESKEIDKKAEIFLNEMKHFITHDNQSIKEQTQQVKREQELMLSDIIQLTMSEDENVDEFFVNKYIPFADEEIKCLWLALLQVVRKNNKIISKRQQEIYDADELIKKNRCGARPQHCFHTNHSY